MVHTLTDIDCGNDNVIITLHKANYLKEFMTLIKNKYERVFMKVNMEHMRNNSINFFTVDDNNAIHHNITYKKHFNVICRDNNNVVCVSLNVEELLHSLQNVIIDDTIIVCMDARSERLLKVTHNNNVYQMQCDTNTQNIHTLQWSHSFIISTSYKYLIDILEKFVTSNANNSSINIFIDAKKKHETKPIKTTMILSNNKSYYNVNCVITSAYDIVNDFNFDAKNIIRFKSFMQYCDKINLWIDNNLNILSVCMFDGITLNFPCGNKHQHV